MSEENKVKCEYCCQTIEGTPCTAYFINHKKQEGLCQECCDNIIKEDQRAFAQDIIKKLCDYTNGGEAKELGEILAKACNCQHRQLQSYLFQAFYHMFRAYAKHDFDDRNHWAVNQAKKWSEVE